MKKNIRERERAQGRKKAAMKKRRRRKALITFLLSFVVVSGLIFAVISAFVFFKVSDVTVKDKSAKYSNSDIINMSGVEIEDNLLLLSKESVANNLIEKLPYIKTVTVEKKFPSSVIISFTETENELCILIDSKYYAADKDGKILANLDAPIENLPLFTLPLECSVKVGKKIEIENSTLYDLFYKYIELTNLYDFEINSVDITNTHDSYMTVENRLKVEMGTPNNFDLKAAHFNSTFLQMPSEAEGTVDLSSWTPENLTAFFTASKF